jgi:hypothetical protein
VHIADRLDQTRKVKFPTSYLAINIVVKYFVGAVRSMTSNVSETSNPRGELPILDWPLIIWPGIDWDADGGNGSQMPSLIDATIEQLGRGLEKGHYTSVDLVNVHD